VLSGNIGEWSEIYTFFKLLADGKLYAANADLSLDPTSYYPIVKIIRQQKDFTFEYLIDGTSISITKNLGTMPIRTISRKDFSDAAENLLSAIAVAQSSFTVPEVNEILEIAEITSLKEPHFDKGDISLVAHDSHINKEIHFSFSIKSQLGAASSLLNASGATNFRFGIAGELTDQEIADLNKLGPKDLLKSLSSRKLTIEFVSMHNEQFETNLKMIDTQMPKIIASLMLAYYSGRGTTLVDLVEIIAADDQLGYGKTATVIYSHKVKTMLTDVALGMTPSMPWTGAYNATGGYIIVKEDGEIVCFHAYNREGFKDYLFHSTKFDTASTNKHHFGNVFRDGDKLWIDLNLLIKFI
jgi:type II restriction enzyme